LATFHFQYVIIYMDKNDKNEILSAINTFAESVDRRFESIDQRFDRMEGRIGKIEGTVVTKDYLGEKLSDLRGDLVILVRKEDNKMNKLIDILTHKQVL